jgi:hypothetical protein
MIENMTESSFDPLINPLPSRYVVGIDLGTTNSAVSYVDSQEDPWVIRVFPVKQFVSATEQEFLETLPSFYYQPVSIVASQTETNRSETSQSEKVSPDDKKSFYVGAFARDETAKTSRRGITSAKSWLCHNAVDRSSPLLPWHGAEDVQKLSPVEVSAAYLAHIRRAWDWQHPDDPLAEQDLILTLPASFDEVARELTIEAAAQAGLPRIVLIEEPQAAFYAWVYKHRDDWERQVTAGQKILICDIGGGTTDFTLIKVRESRQQTVPDEIGVDSAAASQHRSQTGDRTPKVHFHRVAVGNHLILGGDNLDLAVARYLENRLTEGGSLASFQWDLLVGQSRSIKEQMMVEGGPDSILVHLPARGSKLLEGSLQVEVTRDEIRKLLIEGFLPWVELGEKPLLHQSGFQEFGLPFASDPAISKYLARFLVSHAEQPESSLSPGDLAEPEDWLLQVRPDVLLFNGGFFASPLLRQRVIEQICRWFRRESDPDWVPQILDNDRLDLAVARGAAYYGMVRRDQGIRIAATLARSFYIGIGGTPPQAICIMPGSAEPGQSFTLTDRNFKLTVSQPVEFNLYVSSTRLSDQPGALVSIDPEQLRGLPPIRTILKTLSRNEKVDLSVNLQIALTELGTIDLSCNELNSDRSWRLQFDVRGTTQTEIQEHDGIGESLGVLDDSIWWGCESLIRQVFEDSPSPSRLQPQALIQELQQQIQLPREQWPTTLLRRIWESLMELEAGRKFSPQHESRWLNLVGFSLRPGYGCALDDWRVTESWRMVHKKIVHGGAAQKNELLILWRRVAGGLTKGQQLALAEPWLTSIKTMTRQLKGKPGKQTAGGLRPEESTEVWRLLGSLELLPVPQKQELGELIFSIAEKPKMLRALNPMIWAIGRLAQRRPLYGPLNAVLPAEVAEKWIEILMKRSRFGDPEQDSLRNLAIVQMARRTNDRYRDISEPVRSQVVDWLRKNQGPASSISLVLEGGKMDAEELGQVFGESLPAGLRLE